MRTYSAGLDYTETLAMYYSVPASRLTLLQRLVCLCSGLLVAAAQTVDALHPLIWAALAPYLAVLYTRRPIGMRRATSASLWFGIPFWVAFFYWFLALHPLTWTGISWWASIGAAVGGWLILALYHAGGVVLFGALLAVMNPRGWERVLAPALLWVILEWVLQWGTLGIALGRLPVAVVELVPLLQILPWTGPWGLTALIVMVNAALAIPCAPEAVDLRNGRRGRWGTTFGPLLLCAVLAAAVYGFGLWQVELERGLARMTGPHLPVAVVQGNTKVDEKWQWGKLEEVVRSHLQLTREAVRARPGVRLIVWPETAIPIYIHDFPYYLGQLQGIAHELQVSLYVGAVEHRGNHYYNAVLALDDYGRELGMYFKRRLVPFGEYLPGRRFLPVRLAQINVLGHDVAPGTGSAIIRFPFGRVGTLICFESPYPYLVRQTVLDGAELLVVVTNDSWYKRTALLPLHHAHAILRAAETRRYLIRAANTGISSFISPWGEVMARTPILTATYLSGVVKPRADLTFFVRMGDWFVYLAMAAAAWLLLRGLQRGAGP